MTTGLLDPSDSIERQNEKLLQISEVLMRRVEQMTDDGHAAYTHFERAVMLEDQVKSRTRDLERALDLLNVSNAKLAEANRETEEARRDLANAIETLQEGFALFDANDIMVMCNSRFGMHMPDILENLRPGLGFGDYVDSIARSAHLALPEGETRAQWAHRRKRRHRDSHVMFNVRLMRDRWVQVSEHRTEAGGTVIIQTDVSDILRLERQERDRLLDDQARMIRATLDHINQGVCIFDQKRRLVGWNNKISELLSVPLQKLQLGTPFVTLLNRLRPEIIFSDGVTAETLTAWVAAPGARPPLTFEVSRAPDRVFSVFAQQMPDRGFVISFTDVTAERDAARALGQANELLEQRVMERTLELEDALADAERANASKSRFVAAASHDLLQPLSAAKLYIAALEGGGTTGKALSALQSVEQIIEALLDISKLEAGQAEMTRGPVDLGQMMRQLGDEFAPHANLGGLELRIVPCSVTVESDPGYLKRILQNLIANAIRYTDSGRVLLGARHHGSSVRVEVWDTGPGIPEADQDIIFREFQRLNAQASASEGMGLGLAIVERACAGLGHPLGLSSVVGRGTCFFVSLPRASDLGPASVAPRAGPAARRLDAEGLIVLLVEADPDLRRAITMLLEKWGVSVLDVATGDEALALLDEIGIAPDALLVDTRLDDDASALEVIAAIRDRHGTLPARIISADRTPELRQQAAEQGIEILQKPVDPKSFGEFLMSAVPASATRK